MQTVNVGGTSKIIQVFIQDSSVSTGAGLTGLVFNSSGLTCYYNRSNASSATQINLVTMTAGTYTNNGFVEVDGTNMPGWYQLCPPDACFAANATSVAFLLKGATNMMPAPFTVQILDSAIMNSVADHTLRRTLANALASADGDTKAFRSLAGAVAKQVNKVSISGSTLTITETDDSTSLGTQAITTDATAAPITALDTN